jgi:hypothetical protein
MHPRPQLTNAEKQFLQAWIWEEAHAQGVRIGAAKRLQIDNSPYAAPLLADIAVATLSADEQGAIANGPQPSGNPVWPWSNEELAARHREAQTWLEDSRRGPNVAIHGSKH